jgi:hypothetical protein
MFSLLFSSKEFRRRVILGMLFKEYNPGACVNRQFE